MRLREKLLKAIVRVIAHGPYVISVLQNPVMEEFLVELDVVPEGFKFSSRRTVTKRLDEFLDEESASQDSHICEILLNFSGAWDEWSSKQRLNYMAVNVVGITPDFKFLLTTWSESHCFRTRTIRPLSV